MTQKGLMIGTIVLIAASLILGTLANSLGNLAVGKQETSASCPPGQYASSESSSGALTCSVVPNPTSISIFYLNSTFIEAIFNGKMITGGTNASVVIQQTMNSCTAPCNIQIGNGTFTIGNMPLTPRNFEAIYGAGQQVTILKLAPGVSRHLLFENTGHLLNFSIQNIGFDGNKYSQTDPSGTLARINGELVLIAGIGNQHIYFKNDECQNARTGACLDLTGYDVQLADSVVQHNGVKGAAIPCDNVHMGGGNITLAARVSNNFLIDATDTSLAMDNVRGSTISGNYIADGAASDMTLDRGSEADSVSANTFNMTSYSGSWVASTVVEGSASQNISLSSNDFYDNNRTTALNVHLINIVSSKSWTITGGTMVSSIEQPNDFMMQLQSDNNVNIHGVILSSLSGTSPSGQSMIFINGGANITVSGVNFYGGRIGFQFASNVANAVNILGNAFFGTLTPFFYDNNYPTNTIIRDNFGYDSVGKIPNFVYAVGGNFFAPWGTSGTLTPSMTYTITAIDQIITCTGGTGVSITITDNHGNVLATGLAAITLSYLPVGYTINFGPFSTAPTCIDAFN